MSTLNDFAKFEHEGWERVADKYDSTWSKSTRAFIPPLLDATKVTAGLSVLDIGCGPGYVSAAAKERGATPVGLDFSPQMLRTARKMFPGIDFQEGDAQSLPFDDATLDRVVANFALLHVADPEQVCAEAARVLAPGGRFGFTIWAQPADNPYAEMMEQALEAHADLTVPMPEGPSRYLYSGPDEFRRVFDQTGFDGRSMTFQIHKMTWHVPTARYAFDAERTAGVRTAGLLLRQTPERLEKVRQAIEQAVTRYASGDGFALPIGACVIAVSKP